MKSVPGRRKDGGRERCFGCGHPRKEHRHAVGCSVPKCPCAKHSVFVKPEKTPAT